MYNLLNELSGRKCQISTSTDDYYEGEIRRFDGNILVVYEEYEEEEIYLNLLHVVSVTPCAEEPVTEKPKKRGFFSRKDDLEDM